MAMTGLARLLLVFVLGLVVFRDVIHGEQYLLSVLMDSKYAGIRSEHSDYGVRQIVRAQPQRNITLPRYGYTYINTAMRTTNAIENKSFVVYASDENVSIYGSYANVLFSPLPISALGTKYIVSSCHPPGDYTSVLVIATHSQKTDVDITFRLEGNITYDGRRYSDGDSLILSLGEYQTFTIKSDFELTGSVVNTKQTVAVFSGTMIRNSVVAYEELLPVQHFGQEHIVATDNSLVNLRIISVHSDTQITFNNGSTITVNTNGVCSRSLTTNTNLYFSSSKPVMTTLCRQKGGKISFVVVPHILLQIKRTAFGYYGTFKLLSDRNTTDILVRGRLKPNMQGVWDEIPGSRYKVGSFISGGRVSISSSTGFVALVFGGFYVYNGGYNFRSQSPVCDREHYGPDCARTCATRNCIGVSNCSSITGQCVWGCKEAWAGIDCTACDFKHYAINCTGVCSARHCNGYSTCSLTTGQCEGGCETRWTGIDCTVCDGNHYGPDCNRTCATRHCEGNSSCNPTTGQCDSGCQAGWSGIDCKECDDHTYGDGCSRLCVERYCMENSSCHHLTGSCDNGCKPGWRGQDCREVCDREHYGQDCSRVCVTRNCVGVSSCNASTGQCDGKCQTGWTGIDCTECDDYRYGINCSFLCDERYCFGNSSCHHVTGSCDNGCKPGWMGKDCRKVCGIGQYGPDCIETCASRHCDGTSSCSPFTGRCDGECQTGWTGIDCTECDDLTYGNNCSVLCIERHCSGISSCDKVTGSCDNGCEAGWKGRDCTEACEEGHYGPDCTGTCDTRHCEGTSTCIPSTGQCGKGCQAGWTGPACTEVKTSSINYIVVGTVTTGVVILIVVVSIVVWRRRRSVRRATNVSDQIHYVNTSPPQLLNKTRGYAGKDNNALKV